VACGSRRHKDAAGLGVHYWQQCLSGHGHVASSVLACGRQRQSLQIPTCPSRVHRRRHRPRELHWSLRQNHPGIRAFGQQDDLGAVLALYEALHHPPPFLPRYQLERTPLRSRLLRPLRFYTVWARSCRLPSKTMVLTTGCFTSERSLSNTFVPQQRGAGRYIRRQKGTCFGAKLTSIPSHSVRRRA
jgi:hypothetical protein